MTVCLNATHVIWNRRNSWWLHLVYQILFHVSEENLPFLHIVLYKKSHRLFRETQCHWKL